jgi:L-threonylcarbamoyladenylate synthase
MIVAATAEQIAQAAAHLRRGELVAFPTETVYGLGADALNPEAVKAIFAAKGRPRDHPVIVHLATTEALNDWAAEVPFKARLLAQSFWPGPMTLVLPKRPEVPGEVTGQQPTIALRVPAHPVAQALLRAFGGAIAAPSANRFGHVSPTTAQHVASEFPELPLILDGGPCEVGLESTIVDFSQGEAHILRPGRVSAFEISEVIGYLPEVLGRSEVRVPGTLARHYAPQTPCYLVDTAHPEVNEGVISRRVQPEGAQGYWRTLPDDPVAYGRLLYAALRECDALGLKALWIEVVPEDDAWLAVRDRLSRAAQLLPRGVTR